MLQWTQGGEGKRFMGLVHHTDGEREWAYGPRSKVGTFEDEKLVDKPPSREKLVQALGAAGPAHHDYEQNVLAGVRDEQWAGFYAAYVLGRLEDFAPPSSLVRWLERAPSDDDWAESAAEYVLEQLR